MSSPSTATSAQRIARGLKLRAATFEDYPRIADLERRFGLDPRSLEDWKELWLGNPVYRSLPEWSIGWVLEDADRRIVGTMGNIPLAYELGGKRLLTGSGRSWVAEEAYRSLSLQLLDRVVNQPAIDLYLNTTVSANSVATLHVFECRRVPVGLWDQSAFWITHHRGFVESILVKRHGRLLAPLAYPLAAAFRLKDWMSGSIIRSYHGAVESLTSFDDRFDDFWEKLRAANPNVLLAVRTREILDWHFKLALRDRRLWIAVIPDGRAIRAYAIFDRADNRKSGMTRVRLIDFQSLDGDILLPPLLGWALKRCGQEGVQVLENTGRWMEPGGIVRKLAPYRRTQASWSYFYRANHPWLAERLSGRDAWAPTLFDGDASF